MTDIVYCPRPTCGSACITEDNRASCSECYYVFCTICMRLYHGVAPCKDEAGLFKTLSCKYIFPTFNYTNLINYSMLIVNKLNDITTIHNFNILFAYISEISEISEITPANPGDK